MKPPCMDIVKYLLPAIRAKLARELVYNHNFMSKRAAQVLGLSEGAISQYLSSKRGGKGLDFLENSDDAQKVIDEIIAKIVSGDFDFEEEINYLCDLCKVYRDDLEKSAEVDKDPAASEMKC